METHHNPPSPENIMKFGSGFWASKILLAAINFQIFTILAEKKALSAQELKSMLQMKCSDRNVYDFLDALTTFGFLQREGILGTAKYANSVDTDFFLDKKKPTYMGGILEMLNNRIYEFWGNLEEALLTGLPQNEIKTGGGNLFEALYSDSDKLNEFIKAMSGAQMGNFIAFSNAFDFSNYKTLVDVGGSEGLLSIMVAKHQAHMQCTSWDLPPVAPIATKTIEQFQLTDRVKTANGNFFNEAIPAADVVVMGNILHDWDEETKIMLMQKAYDALPPGGAYVTIEAIIDDERNKNGMGLMMSLNMLIETGNGFDYTFADFNQWAKKVGFQSTNKIPLTGPSSAAIAYK